MTHAILDWISPSVTQHVALALLHSLWQGVLVGLASAVALYLLRDGMPGREGGKTGHPSPVRESTRANTRYSIACLGLLVMAALPVVNLMVMETPTGTAGGVLDGASFDTLPRGDSVAAVEMPVSQSTVAITPAIDQQMSAQIDPKQAYVPTAAATSPTTIRTGQTALQWLFWAWFVGVVLLSIWHMVGWALAQRLRRGGIAAPDQVVAVAETVARRLGIRRAVAVRQTLVAAVPMVIGWVKPALIVPVSVVTGLPPHELEAVLSHELAHVRRHDYLVNLCQTVIETLMFYHPAVWWLSHRIRCEREFCADDLAMRVCDRREVYARSLVAVAEIARKPARRAVAATGGSLFERIRRIVRATDDASAPRRGGRSALVGVAATVCLGVVLLTATRSGPASESQSAEETTEETTEPSTSVDASDADGISDAARIALAELCVERLRQGQLHDAVALFDRSFRNYLHIKDFGRVWDEYDRPARAGEFKDIISSEVKELHGHHIVELRGRWDKAVMLLRFSVAETGITGFWLARDQEGPTPLHFHRRGYSFGADMKRLVRQVHGPTREELANYGIDVRILGTDGKPIDQPSMVTIWKKLDSEPEPRDRTMEDPRDGTVWKRVTGSISGQRSETRNGKDRFLTGKLDAGLYRVTAFVGSRKEKMLGMATSEPIRLDGLLTTTPLTITVEDGPPVSFTVVDAETREPINYPRPGIRLTRSDGLDVEYNPLNGNLFPGEDGKFRIEDLAPGSYQVNVSAKSTAFGYSGYELPEPITINVGVVPANEFALELRAVELDDAEVQERWPWVIEGVVADDEGHPIEGAEIRAFRAMGGGTKFGTMPVITDENGRYLIRVGPSIAVLKYGKPDEEGTILQFKGLRAWKDGYVEKDRSWPGSLAMADGMPEELGDVDRDSVMLPGQPRRLDFTLALSAGVEGILVDANGDPLANESIRLSRDELRSSGIANPTVKTDSEGRFSFDRIAPNVERWFELHSRGWPPFSRSRKFTPIRGEKYRVALEVVSRLTREGKTEQALRVTEFKDSQGGDLLQPLIESEPKPVGAEEEMRPAGRGAQEADIPKHPVALPELVEEVLWWLPEDTETISVVQSFEILTKEDQEELEGRIELTKFASFFHMGVKGFGWRRQLLTSVMERLGGRKVSVTLEGARHFSNYGSLGPGKYEGCCVIVFEEDAHVDVATFFESLRSLADETPEVEQQEVFVIRKKENQAKDLYLSSPRPGILLSATDETYLGEVLRRMATRGKSRALPSNLPEWQYLDPNAPLWAVRHFAEDARGDKRTTGAVFALKPEGREVAEYTYLSTDPKALGQTLQSWVQPEAKLNPTISEGPAGTVLLTHDLREVDTESLLMGMIMMTLQLPR